MKAFMDFHPLSTKSEYLLIEFILNSTRGGGHSKSKTGGGYYLIK